MARSSGFLSPLPALLFLLPALLPASARALPGEGEKPARPVLDLSGKGWRLWLDREAPWKEDALYLPGDLPPLSSLPAHPPSCGWAGLDERRGIPVSLPSTVEEHYWGKLGLRPYASNEYEYWYSDKEVKNGNYLGVSWWWRKVRFPASFRGRKVLLHFRGARLRAEVFLDGRLVGYRLVGETPFTADLTEAARPGEEQLLAVRITNPGGRMEWNDTTSFRWGKYLFPTSHGFGGLDGGIYAEALPPVYVEDLFCMNRPDPREVTLRIQVRNETGKPLEARLLAWIHPEGLPGKKEVSRRVSGRLAPGVTVLEETFRLPRARLWSPDHPFLYKACVLLRPGGNLPSDGTTRRFGFRWFEARGVGEDARLYLNGRQILPVSAISWGFWGPNGLWPGKEEARKEVRAAKALGLTMLNFHRCIGRPAVLDAQDELGLLRYEEPGAGERILAPRDREHWGLLYAPSPKGPVDTSGRGGEPKSFAARYELAKVLAMVRRDRNHPSLVLYCLQNEIWPDLRNPKIFYTLRRMHEIDPTRIILLKSGIEPRNQAWVEPYSGRIRHDDGTGFSGWWDRHTVGGPGLLTDSFYRGPRRMTPWTENKKEIVMWGEMLGAPPPDDHQAVLSWYARTGRRGYDRADRARILAGYRGFLSRWGFTRAFPSPSDLFRSAGDRAYAFWGRVVENGRIGGLTDLMVLSGWESTTIDNHSGLVDCHRNLKGDAELLRRYTRPFLLSLKARNLVVEKGASLLFDVYLAGRSPARGKALLLLRARDPRGRILRAWKKEILLPDPPENRLAASLLAEGLSFAPDVPGFWRIEGDLRRGERSLVEGREEVYCLAWRLPGLPPREGAALVDPRGLMTRVLAEAGRKYPAFRKDMGKLRVLAAAPPSGTGGVLEVRRPIAGTSDDPLYRTEENAPAGELVYTFTGLPPGTYRVTLKFAEIWHKRKGARVFDAALNGKTVLKDFDVLAEAGGPDKAVDRTFQVNVGKEGRLVITFPRARADRPKLSALLLQGPKGFVKAVNCGGKPYKDRAGLVWGPRPKPVYLDPEWLRRVREEGTLLVLLPDTDQAAAGAAREAARLGIWKYHGLVGPSRAPWMGAWYFSRPHPLFAGLPSGKVLSWVFQPAGRKNGLLLEGKRVSIPLGYGRDHDSRLGAGCALAPYGKGRILLFCTPGLYSALAGPGRAWHPLTARRLLANALALPADH